jgi:type II secretory pathway pseudopilin PulG
MITMRQIFRKEIKNDSGLTLTELLIYLVITAFLSLGISRLITDSAAGLDRASQESVAARQVIRFSNTLKYDISGATDVIVLPASPLSTDPVCTVANMNSLFTVRIKTLATPTVGGGNAYDDAPSSNLATYGLYKDNSVANSKWYLRRVTCAPTAMTTPLNSENLIDLGSAITPGVVGKDVLLCDGAQCATSTSTTDIKSYKFQLPYNGRFSTLKNLTSSGAFDLVHTLTRRVDEI